VRRLGHEVLDEGTNGGGSIDYPDVAARGEHGQQRRSGAGDTDLRHGIGMSIAANKFPGVRAPCHDDLTAEMSRRHNDLNVLCLRPTCWARRIDRMVEIWLNTPFEGGRHARRVWRKSPSLRSRRSAARDSVSRFSWECIVREALPPSSAGRACRAVRSEAEPGNEIVHCASKP
jgi:ribose 5-phosphate isomerase B